MYEVEELEYKERRRRKIDQKTSKNLKYRAAEIASRKREIFIETSSKQRKKVIKITDHHVWFFFAPFQYIQVPHISSTRYLIRRTFFPW